MFRGARPEGNRWGRRSLGVGLLLLVCVALGSAASPAASVSSPGADAAGSPAVDFWEGLPASTALLLPVAVGLAGLIGVALGPGGRPAPIHRREGGLSRALARRSGDPA